jgi:4-hydroxy-3-methylbut-2-enyl diphosphate reductase
MDIKEFGEIQQLIYNRMKEKSVADPEQDLVVFNTICGQVSGREPNLRAFASMHDTVIFVSGRDSSNGKMLYAICKSINPDTHFISSVEEIEKSWFSNKKSIGICGATSTPKWLIKNIRDFIAGI